MKAWVDRSLIWLGLAGLGLLSEPRQAHAGMPTVLLSDLARMRFQVLSFFLLVLLVCTWIIQRIWNGLANDFPRLPRLGFARALGLVTLWGFLFVLILTMISGARELMTPGAWKKQGFTYALAEGEERRQASTVGDPARATEESENDAPRREALDRLRVALWKYALTHEGRFPAAEARGEIPAKAWEIADPSGLHFVYRPGLVADEGAFPLAYEPGLFGRDRWLLLTDGTLEKRPIGAIREAIKSSKNSVNVETKSVSPKDYRR